MSKILILNNPSLVIGFSHGDGGCVLKRLLVNRSAMAMGGFVVKGWKSRK
jgi:hypothetical protein